MAMDRILEQKKGLKKKHIFWIGGGVILIAMILMIIFSDHSSVFRAEKDKLTISPVEKGLFNDYITVIGNVEPITTIFLDAIESGRVSERIIEEGSMVKAGDIILRLENEQLYQTILSSEAAVAEKENYLRNTKIEFETQLIQSRRNVLDSEHQLSQAKRTFKQYESLYKDELISKEEYTVAKENFEYQTNLLELNKVKAKNDSLIRITSMLTLETDLQTMRKMLVMVRDRLDNLNVRSPVDGQLGMLEAEVGQSFSQGQRIGQVNVLNNFKVSAKIDEHYIDRVNSDLSGTFERGSSNYNLSVKKVYPEVREGQFEIDMVFGDSLPENIRTGQTYHIRLELGEPSEAILLPRGGFFQSTGGQWVFVLDKDQNAAVKRNITIGKQNPQYYEVLEGLEPGEQVITSGYELFGNNEKIVFK